MIRYAATCLDATTVVVMDETETIVGMTDTHDDGDMFDDVVRLATDHYKKTNDMKMSGLVSVRLWRVGDTAVICVE